MAERLVVPDRIGEVIAWRAWKVIGSVSHPLLASVSQSGTVWHPDRWTFATCDGDTRCTQAPMSDDRIPGVSCTCGLYAAASRGQLVRLGYNRDSGHKPVFIGQVAFAGKVIPGRQGWRAEKGRIDTLYVPHVHWRYVDPLEAMYQVEVVLDNTQSAKEVI